MAESLDIEREKIDAIDRQIAELFAKRMDRAKNIADIKSRTGLPIFDKNRENEILERCVELVPHDIENYYREFLKCQMRLSRAYQSENISLHDTLEVATKGGSYRIKIKPGGISEVGKIFDLDRRVLVVTDSGVPEKYAQVVASQCKEPTVITLSQGENAKSIETFCVLEKAMLDSGFSRSDCVVAVGGGVVGDISGYAASSYMRGIDFYNVPTTLLAQIDSSVGGKTAVNFGGVKNLIGAFKQPCGVLIDTKLLSTLDKRQMSNGFAEAIKSALICDGELFEMIETLPTDDIIDIIVRRVIEIKKSVVEQDEFDLGLRKILNFGHTIGHAVEVQSGMLHGECVALGMLPMVSSEIRERLIPLYEKLGLPTKYEIGDNFEYLILHDKKADRGKVTAVKVDVIGKYRFAEMTAREIEDAAREVLSK